MIDELKRRGISARNIEGVYKVMVILSPSPVENRIFDFSCVNLVEFMRIMERGSLASLIAIDIQAETELLVIDERSPVSDQEK